MSGMYPSDETLELFGKQIKFPGMDKDGKFTNGDFSDPLVPPSRLDAGTLNLIIDNLNNVITAMGGTPDNETRQQLAELFAVEVLPHKGVKRDAAGRAQVAAPAAADDVARKAEVDAEATARANADGALQTNLNNHVDNTSNPHTVTKSQVGLGSADNTADSQKSVNYAASSGNADTVDGYHAGAGVNQLVPVTASMFGASAGYIKYANGLIIQWMQGTNYTETYCFNETLPVAFRTHFVMTGAGIGVFNGTISIKKNGLTGFSARVANATPTETVGWHGSVMILAIGV